MATNYFPAAQPYLAPDPMAQLGKTMALRNTMQQMQYEQQMRPLQLQAEQQQIQQQQQAMQIQAQQVKDIQAGQDAYGEWDGKDYGDLAKGIIKHGGSLASANQVAQYGLQQQEKLSSILRNNAEAGKAQVETTQKNNDLAAGKIQSLLDLPDESLQQGLLNLAQQGKQEGWLDPTHAQQAQQLAQLSPAQLRQYLPHVAKSYLSESQQAEQALKQYDIEQKKAQAQTATAEYQSFQTWQQQPKNAGKTYAQYQNEMAATKAAGEAWARLGAEKNLEQYKIQLQQSFLPEGLKTTDPKLATQAAADYIKHTGEYLTTVQNAQNMQDVIDAARKGNVVAYRYIPQESTMEVTTTAGIKKINMTEIKNVARSGSAWDRIKGAVMGEVSGKSLDPKIVDAFEATSNDVLNRATQKYQNNVGATNYTYNSTFKPMQPQLPQSSKGGAAALPPEARAKLQEGHVTTFGNGQQWTLQNGQAVQVNAK